MTEDGRGGDIAGTHGPMWSGGMAAIILALMIATLVALVRATDIGWGALATTVVFASWFAVRWSDRTVVSPAGVRVRRWFRWRTLPWDAITAVAEPGRWSRIDVIAVITAEGETVTLDVPGYRRTEFIEYAQSHGMPPKDDRRPKW